MSRVSTKNKNDELLSPEFTSKLEQFDILSRKKFTGRMKGERRRESVEFAEVP